MKLKIYIKFRMLPLWYFSPEKGDVRVGGNAATGGNINGRARAYKRKKANMQSDNTPCNRTTTNFGFEILRQKQLLKLRLDERGQEGRIAFLQACIASGIDHGEDLIDELLDITGPHAEFDVRHLLAEGEGSQWEKSPTGHFHLTDNL